MSLRDRYGLPLSTDSVEARDAFDAAGEAFLAAQPEARPALERALAADPGFALAHMLQARLHQVLGEGAAARTAADRAAALAETASARERSHVAALQRVVAGDRAGARAAIEAHMADWPRDALVLLPVAGVFGVFGFSGTIGWEPRLLAFLSRYEPHLSDDWWYLGALAFAQAEVGHLDAAGANVERSLGLNPSNANAAHVRAHVHYEAGEDEAGLAWLEAWHRHYARAGYMHCHLGWHVALWNLDLDRTDAAWSAYRAFVQPAGGAGVGGARAGGARAGGAGAGDGLDEAQGAWGPPLNVLTDAASFLFRAELAGGARPSPEWSRLADYARARFPGPGAVFPDVHAALAFAMSGASGDLEARTRGATGPAGAALADLATAFDAFARERWLPAAEALERACRNHERIGGSHAQRDMLEIALAVASRRAGLPDRTAAGRPRASPVDALGSGADGAAE